MTDDLIRGPLTITVHSLIRPDRHLAMIDVPGGVMKPGVSVWTAAVFTADIDPFRYSGKFLSITLILDKESWQFDDAILALTPQKFKMYPEFVLIFSKCIRLPDIT